MDTKTFLSRVTAPTDELLVCIHKPDPAGKDPRGIFWQRGSYADLDDAVAAITKWDTVPEQTVYFTVGRFAGHKYINDKGHERYHRYKHLATSFKALALDLDIGPDKPYATQRDGWIAMQKALAFAKLPMPMVVSSGNGIHCYWPLTVAVSALHWEKASIALRFALEDGGVQIDTSKIHDPTMVLRPVGTHHKKQFPWKEVKLVADCTDYEPVYLFGQLRNWFGRVPALISRTPRAARAGSSVMNDLKGDGDIVHEAVAAQCAQLGALHASGGTVDATGQPVSYSMWTRMVQFAGRCVDPAATITAMGGNHPKFDLQEALAKKDSFGSGVPYCKTFDATLSGVCPNCPHWGVITHPGQLSQQLVIEPPPGRDAVELPEGYLVQDGKIWMDEEKEVISTQPDGKKTKAMVRARVLVCPYIILLVGIFTDHEYSVSTATIAVRYPLGNWQEHEMPLSLLAGRDFADFLINKQVFVVGVQTLDRTRTYLMRYLELVQQQAPTGADFHAFGWQPDGSFLCGETLLGAPSGNTSRRLKGAAARFANIIKPTGDRSEWVRATSLLDTPSANNMAAAMMIGTVGILGSVPGNSSFIWALHSSKTTTGKTLSLHGACSLMGHPRSLILNAKDTANAVYKIRGTLNNLPCAMDEVTMLDDTVAVDICYNLSQGREKLSLTKDRDVREAVTWEGPTMMTCNISLYDKYELVMSQNDPVRARTFQFEQNDNVFVSQHGSVFYDLVDQNYGWATPEIVADVIARGGPAKVWEMGLAAFHRKFGFAWEPEERFYRTGVIESWILSTIAANLGLFKFNVNRVTQHMLDRVVYLRSYAKATRLDAFDIVGQFLQEHHDALIISREEYMQGGKGRENVQYPLPVRAVARLNLVYDAQHPVLPGSKLIINTQQIKRWLSKVKDSLPRLLSELQSAGALISERDRITLYKGCQNENPGQAICIIINANHPRFAAAMANVRSAPQSPVTLAIVHGAQP